MSIQTELTRITNAKAAIKAAIEVKGVTVPDATLLDGMASLIESIETGGGGKIARGTFIPAENHSLNLPYGIEHNCGFVPDVFIVSKENLAYTQYSIKLAVSFPTSFYSDDYVSIDRSAYTGHAYGWTSANYSLTGGSGPIGTETTDKVAYIRSNSANNRVIAGESYIWIAIGVVL